MLPWNVGIGTLTQQQSTKNEHVIGEVLNQMDY